MPAFPRAILFDLDETLITFGDRQDLFRQVAELYPDQIGPMAPRDLAEMVETGFRAFWADETRAGPGRLRLAHSRRTIVGETFERLKDRAPGLTPAFALEFADRFHAHREGQMAPFPGALETVHALKNQGIRLALVTNGAAELQRPKVEKFDLEALFQHVQIEGEHGFGKPEPRAYLHAMERLGVGPEETWMVGDNLEWEVTAPQKLGIHAIWHDHRGTGLPAGATARPDRIIRAVSDLLEVPA